MTRQRLLIAVLLLAVSITAMASHIMDAQRAKVADESGDRGRYDRAKAAYDKAVGELTPLAGVRTIAAVRAGMDQAPVPAAVFQRTKQCTEVTRDDSFAACKPVLDLRQEMAQAIRKRELDGELPRLKADLDRLQRPEEANASETALAGWWAWIMGIAVVLVATFGTVVFARVETVPPGSANDNRRTASGSPIPPLSGGHPAPDPIEHAVITALRKAGRPLSNRELANALGVSEGEATKTRAEVGDRLDVSKAGKALQIQLRRTG